MLQQMNKLGGVGVIQQLEAENEDVGMQERIRGEERKMKEEKEQEDREEKERHQKIHRTRQERERE